MSRVVLPRPPEVYDTAWADDLIRQIELAFQEASRAAATGYQPSNVTSTRAFDADATTLAEVADVLGTLIEDLKARGLLSK